MRTAGILILIFKMVFSAIRTAENEKNFRNTSSVRKTH